MSALASGYESLLERRVGGWVEVGLDVIALVGKSYSLLYVYRALFFRHQKPG